MSVGMFLREVSNFQMLLSVNPQILNRFFGKVCEIQAA